MFTGLTQSIGSLHVHSRGVLIKGFKTLSPLSLGESVSVDGVCLTVAELTLDGFLAAVSEETLKRTTLGLKAKKGSSVNLEQALRFSDRLGGHIVSGHVDGLGKVVDVKSLQNSWQVDLCWGEPLFGRYICDKASITLNGISLTVASCSEAGDYFSLSIIPHTWDTTNMKDLRVGDLVNLEADLLAKYTERLLKHKSPIRNNPASQGLADISKEWLSANGW